MAVVVAVAERTKAPLLEGLFLQVCGRGSKPAAAKIRYLLSFREFQLVAY